MLDSDDSAASEVASEPEDPSLGVAESAASEIGESNAAAASPRTRTNAPAAASGGEDDYEDDYEEEEEEDGYSDDFDDADGYGEASFEDESRRSASVSVGAGARHVVDLSVRAARASPAFRPDPARLSSGGDDAARARQPSLSASSAFAGSGGNSPSVNLKVLSKPPRLPTVALAADVDAVAADVAPPAVVAPPLVAAAPRGGDERSLALLLRKVESKFEDELEELRERAAVLAWRERELKAELRREREERRLRRARIDKKRRRAAERRHEHERMLEALRAELQGAEARAAAADERAAVQRGERDALEERLAEAHEAARAADERALALAGRLQAALEDLHARARDFEAAVGARIEAERRADALAAAHAVELQVLRRTGEVDLEAARRELAREAAAREAERETLPEVHRRAVEAEKERFERLEAARAGQLRALEAQAARDGARLEGELAKVAAAAAQAEERAEQRVQTALAQISHERDAVDEQRRELLVAAAKAGARQDEERARLDALRCQLEARAARLADDRVELEARAAALEARERRLDAGETAAEAKRAELAALGRETLDRSRALARRAAEFAAMEKELRRRREREQELLQSLQSREQKEQELAQRARAVDEVARQLQTEQLALAKQRAQSRRFLDGARQLERLMELRGRQAPLEADGKRGPAGRRPSDNQRDDQR